MFRIRQHSISLLIQIKCERLTSWFKVTCTRRRKEERCLVLLHIHHRRCRRVSTIAIFDTEANRWSTQRTVQPLLLLLPLVCGFANRKAIFSIIPSIIVYLTRTERRQLVSFRDSMQNLKKHITMMVGSQKPHSSDARTKVMFLPLTIIVFELLIVSAR